jgi:hypothetical protein
MTLAVTLTMVLNYSCNRESVSKDSMDEIINKEVSVKMLKAVHKGNTEYSWADFRKEYHNISIVFLQDGCAPCYPKFIEWHKRMEQITTANDYTVLFVINARHYENFVRNARTYGEFDERYFHVMDPDNRFMIDNLSIPRMIIDRSLLIDRTNHLKMVGEPFANADMTKVFHIVTGVDTHNPGESK